jgi:hypothetical protein
MAQHLAPASTGAAAATPLRLPTLVRTIVLEGCVQLIAWAVGARPPRPPYEEPPPAAADDGGAPQPGHVQRREQEVLQGLLAGSGLLRAAAAATLQAGATVATLHGAARAPSFAPLCGRAAGRGSIGAGGRVGVDLGLLYAWPCCLPTAASCGDGAAVAAPTYVELRLAPASAAAAAGVRWLPARALLSDGAGVLLDAPLVLDTARPVARCG